MRGSDGRAARDRSDEVVRLATRRPCLFACTSIYYYTDTAVAPVASVHASTYTPMECCFTCVCVRARVCVCAV